MSYKMKDCGDDRYNGKYISCDGNRKLINAAKKAGLKTFAPVGEWNGYGYAKLPTAAAISSIADLKKFNACVKEIEEKPVKTKTQTDKKAAWVKRLHKLTACGLDVAEQIAEEKLSYKEEKISEMEARQYEHYSVKRATLIRQMERENPLRRIENKDHALSILAAHDRHSSDYDKKLKAIHELEHDGVIDKGSAKEMAHTMTYNEIMNILN
jgi:ribosomal protein L7/L12